jgi:hypothetical protein
VVGVPEPRYARRTEVTAQKTRAELENELRRWGASQFGYNLVESRGEDPGEATIVFTIAGVLVRMSLSLPARTERRFTHTDTGIKRSVGGARDAWDAEVRRRWRELYFVTKAKLVAVHAGISTLEREFLSDVVVADERGTETTVGQALAPRLLEQARTRLRAIEGRS